MNAESQDLLHDIAAEQRAEAALRDARQFSEQVILSAQEGFTVYGPDLRYQQWNPFMEKLTGLPASEVLGKHPLELFPFLETSGATGWLDKALGGATSDLTDVPFAIPRTGKSGWVAARYSPFRNAQGQIIGVLGTLSDITERKRAEAEILRFNGDLEAQVRTRTAELQQARDFSQALIQDSPAYVVALSPQGRVQVVNQALLQAVGACEEELLGRRFLTDLVPPEGRAAMSRALRDLRGHNGSGKARVPIRTAYGTILQVEWRTRAVLHPDGQLKHFLGVGIDVTGLERQERLQEVRIRILEALAGRENLATLQGMLVDHLQEVWPDHPVSLRILDPRTGTLKTAINRGLPDFYTAAISGLEIGPGVGCSGAAAHGMRRVVADDLQTHPNWVGLRELAARAGLGACWSEPIISSAGAVFGTLAVYAHRPERPTQADLRILHEVASLANFLYERRLAEEELALRGAAMKAAANALVIIDREGLIQWANPAFGTLTGYVPDQVQGEHIRILKSGHHNEAFYEDLWTTVLSGQVWKGELVNRRKDGSPYFEAQTVTPVLGEAGAITHFIAIKQDVTDQKANLARLKKLSQAVEQAPSTVVITDVHGVIEYVNPHFAEMTGYAPEEALGRNPSLLRSGLTPAFIYQDLWETILGGRVWRGELVNRRKDGMLFWERIAIAPVLDDLGAITHFVANTEDITGQRLMAENHQRLSAALEQAEDAVAILDPAGIITFANPAFHKVLGAQDCMVLAEPIERFLEDPALPGRLAEMLGQAREGRAWKGRHRVQSAGARALTLDGTVSPVRDLEGNISSLALVFRDVSLELERGRQLIQAQKMDSLGALAGGVAHDFNNILSAILTTAELIELQLEPDSPIRPRLAIIYQVSQQARALNQQILSFSRRSEEKLIPFDLSHVLREALNLLKATLPRTILLDRELAPSIWVSGDPAQIHQVVMNLAINGCHAIGDGEGHLTVTLGERELAEDDGLPLSAGRYAELCVRDTGSGMDPMLLERIFEPFFTTKEAGTGTGLGLSVVHGIVQGHGGHILVESVPGQGSAFRVFIPCTQAQGVVPPVDRAGESRGSESILLVDDEDIVTALSKQGLEALGYHVVAKTSPADALEVFQARPGAFDLLITDLALPGFSGAELTRRIRRLRPGMPAILVTGTLDAIETMPSLAVTFDETLAKPLAPKDLGASIRRVLDTRKLL